MHPDAVVVVCESNHFERSSIRKRSKFEDVRCCTKTSLARSLVSVDPIPCGDGDVGAHVEKTKHK